MLVISVKTQVVSRDQISETGGLGNYKMGQPVTLDLQQFIKFIV